jgi:hypothetical protein
MSAEEHDPENWESAPDESTAATDPSEIAAQVTRGVFWRSLESTDAETSQFADRLCSAARRQQSRAVAWRWWRGIASIAACVALSFTAGWALHSHRVSSLASHLSTTNSNKTNLFHVSLTDERGRVTAVQPFDSMEKAREFARDVGQWRERAIQVHQGTPVIVADRF